jgi:hypothetical protein
LFSNFENLPVIIVDTYKYLNRSFLENQWKVMCHKTYDYKVLTFPYWKDLILNVKQNGIKLLNQLHPIKFKNGDRYYTQNLTQLEETWAYITIGFR